MAAAAKTRGLRVATRMECNLAYGEAPRPDPDCVQHNAAASPRTREECGGSFNADRQGRSGGTPIWSCAQQGGGAQSVMDGRTITNVTGAYSNSSIVWRHTAKSPAETAL